MFYLVYKIIQLSTHREYIGQHQTDNLNDGYMGSGTLIAPAVEANPTDFVKTILWYCDSADEMNELEAALVTEEYLLANFSRQLASLISENLGLKNNKCLILNNLHLSPKIN